MAELVRKTALLVLDGLADAARAQAAVARVKADAHKGEARRMWLAAADEWDSRAKWVADWRDEADAAMPQENRA